MSMWNQIWCMVRGELNKFNSALVAYLSALEMHPLAAASRSRLFEPS